MGGADPNKTLLARQVVEQRSNKGLLTKQVLEQGSNKALLTREVLEQGANKALLTNQEVNQTWPEGSNLPSTRLEPRRNGKNSGGWEIKAHPPLKGKPPFQWYTLF